MGDIFDSGDADVSKLELDTLFEKNRQIYEKKRAIYNRVLRLCHKTIQTAAKTKQYCWYDVPEFIWGSPSYSNSECIAHLMYELKENDFMVRYIHPSKLFIVWQHWVPTYMRTQIKTRHGIRINQYGQILPPEDEDDTGADNPTHDSIKRDPNSGLFMEPGAATGMQSRGPPQKNYRPTQSYKPRGVYNEELLNKLGEKLM